MCFYPNTQAKPKFNLVLASPGGCCPSSYDVELEILEASVSDVPGAITLFLDSIVYSNNQEIYQDGNIINIILYQRRFSKSWKVAHLK